MSDAGASAGPGHQGGTAAQGQRVTAHFFGGSRGMDDHDGQRFDAAHAIIRA